MSSENWQPDPSWDYWEFWNNLITLKNQIDEAISLLVNEETSNNDVDYKVAEILQEPIDEVQAILDGIHLEMVHTHDDKSA